MKTYYLAQHSNPSHYAGNRYWACASPQGGESLHARDLAKRFSSMTEIVKHYAQRTYPYENLTIIKVEESTPGESRRVLAEFEQPKPGETVKFGFGHNGSGVGFVALLPPGCATYSNPLNAAQLFETRKELLAALQTASMVEGRKCSTLKTLSSGSDIIRVAVSVGPATVKETVVG